MRKSGLEPRAARGSPGRRLYLGVGSLGLLSCVLLVGLTVWQAARERVDLLKREKDALSRLTQVISTETADMFGRIRLFFEAADLWLAENPTADPRTNPSFLKLVAAFDASVNDRIVISLVSSAGLLYQAALDSLQSSTDVNDRGYFTIQSSIATRGFRIGEPVESRVTGARVIPVSYPLSSRNAGVSVIVAFIELPYIEELYEAIRPKPNGSAALVRRDGILLAHAPFDATLFGASLADSPRWTDRLATLPSGVEIFRESRRDDGQERIIAYSSLASPELVVSVSARVDDVLAAWKSGLGWRALLAALMIVVIGTVSESLLAALGRLDAAQAELRGNLERLKQSDATKDKLFSVIAHDLRGPIGGMCNLLETMSTDRGDMRPEVLDEFIGALRLTSWNTYQLLENLLAWSRSKRGEMPFRPERVLVFPLIEECEQVFALSMADKGLSVEVEIEPGLEARADPELLKVVVRNLLSNAVKFTKRDGRIHVSGAREARGARIAVHDEGIGMNREELDALFDLGSTRSRTGTANERGSGLGLVLSKEIVELHGGMIEAESVAGAGSTFAVFLPDEAPERTAEF